MADKSENLIVGLDIGSSKTICLIAQPVTERQFKIEGIGMCGSVGIREGSVVDMSLAIDSIRRAVEEAEKTAQTSISKVTAGISGTHVFSVNTEMTQVTRRGEVEQSDVDEISKNVQATSLPPSMRYLSIIPREYAVDFKWGIHSPVGLEGKRLDARLHVVTAQSSPCQNISRALRRCGLELVDNRLNFNPLASAAAVITPEEKKLGVLVIDIGAELTDVALYYDDSVHFTAVFPGGGEQLTNEISIKTQLSTIDAEDLKCRMGQVRFNPRTDPADSYELPTYAGFFHGKSRILTRQALSAIIDAKLFEHLEFIYHRLREKNFHRYIGHGIVLTGGGSELPHITRLVREVFSQHLAGRDINVRIGRPIVDYASKIYRSPSSFSDEAMPEQLDGISKPEFSTVMGYVIEQNYRQWQSIGQGRKGVLSRWKDLAKSWVIGNF